MVNQRAAKIQRKIEKPVRKVIQHCKYRNNEHYLLDSIKNAIDFKVT